MSFRPGSVLSGRSRRSAATTAAALALCLAAAGCNTDSGASKSAGSTTSRSSASASPSASASATPVARSAARVATNVARRGVKVSKVVTLTAKDGTFSSVTVKAGKAKLPGALSGDKVRWTSSQRLEPGKTYRVRAVAVDDNGLKTVKSTTFSTQTLTLAQQTYPSFVPVAGETVGVGMPVIVRFDVPIAHKAAIEKHLTVTSTSHQKGAWHWISDSEVHWRPVHYWKPGTDVTVKADINSVPAGNGIFGQLSRTSTFHIGRSVISRVNAATHQMKTFINGKLVKTTPITTGKPGFDTRSGVKVIIEKFRHKRMDSETIGIAHNSANGYDLDDVEYAMRVTYSGEFLHAAPWSVGSQGYANVSHGCTGMSTSNAAWLYANSKPGDVVEYTGTNKQMTLDNGYGDWNESFAAYAKGSVSG
jgi:lipoprotein-anchoring transpeptidase ErfK/SrfK